MKTAREVAHECVYELESNCREVIRRDGDEHCGTCDEITAAIEAARKEGAAWMREQAASCAKDPQDSWMAQQIRALPTVPK